MKIHELILTGMSEWGGKYCRRPGCLVLLSYANVLFKHGLPY